MGRFFLYVVLFGLWAMPALAQDQNDSPHLYNRQAAKPPVHVPVYGTVSHTTPNTGAEEPLPAEATRPPYGAEQNIPPGYYVDGEEIGLGEAVPADPVPPSFEPGVSPGVSGGYNPGASGPPELPDMGRGPDLPQGGELPQGPPPGTEAIPSEPPGSYYRMK